MSILQEILKWSQTLPAWQSDAIARLFAKEVLSDDDLDDLFALLKVEHGISDPKGRAANKLSAEQIPAPALPSTQVKLLALKNLRHVNRIADNQRLGFSAPYLAQTLVSDFYKSNSAVARLIEGSGLEFSAVPEFTRNALEQRSELLYSITKKIGGV